MRWGETIYEDLGRRLAEGGDGPVLSLPALARHYGVSVTPVRQAVRRLLEEGLLERGPNGRLRAGPKAGRGEGPRAVEERQVPVAAEQQLIEEIARCSLSGVPVFLREQALADRLGMGRTLLRQHLNRLAGADLLEHVPRRGWRVHPVREEDVQAFLEIRATLEIKALALARDRLEPSMLKKLLTGNPPPRRGASPRLDDRLHAYLLRRANNRYLEQFFNQPVARYYEVLFNTAAPEARVVAEMAEQHRRILRALLNKDWAQARRTLLDHIRAQSAVIHRVLPSPPPRGGPGLT